MKYYTGNIDPWWTYEHQNLSYQKNDYRDPVQLKKWKQEGYSKLDFSGNYYSGKYETSEFAERFKNLFDWDDISTAFLKLTTEQFMPQHQDHYQIYQKIFSVSDPRLICRCVVFLESWSPGHYFDIADHGITNWSAGDYVVWQYDTPHSAGNVGLADRYTVQITGTARDVKNYYKLKA